MRRMSLMLALLFVIVTIGCHHENAATESGYKSLRVVDLNTENKQVFYVPTRAVLRGSGKDNKLVAIDLGQKKLFQGMINLQEDENELKQLVEEMQKKYGPDIKVSKDLTTDVDVKVTSNEKVLWEHRIFTSSSGLPFQVTVPGNASVSLTINMKFSPSGAGATAKKSITTQTHTKTYTSNGKESSGKEMKLLGKTESKNDQSLQEKFEVEQIIEF